jgi:hypothetical protein
MSKQSVTRACFFFALPPYQACLINTQSMTGCNALLATQFDDEPDAQGRLFSELHEKKEKTKFCCGTVKRVLADKLHYKLLWDGDKRQCKSAAAHLSLFTEDDSDSSSSSDSGSDDGDDGSSAAGSDDGDGDVLLAPRPEDVTRTKARG